MTLEAQRLYDTGQGGDELSNAVYRIIKADQAKKARKSERMNRRLEATSSRIVPPAAAATR